MPRTITTTTTVYKFDELSDKAKEKARDWWRETETESELFGAHGELFETAETAAALLGITFDRHNVKLMGNNTRSEPKIYWGLYVQGSGASFEGCYEFKPDAMEAIVAEFPTDKTLHAIAAALLIEGPATAVCDCERARYPHSGWMNVTVYDVNGEEIRGEVVRATLREFADWIYKGIDEEWTYRMSDENIDESIRCNEYEFNAHGAVYK